MMRHQRRKASRARGGALAREINIPLPTRGVFSEAKHGEISGLYAAELTNWRSTGVSIEQRQSYSLEGDGRLSLQRIPFEYGGAQDFIEIGMHRIQFGELMMSRSYAGQFTVSFISGYGVLADGGGAPVLVNETSIAASTFTTSTGMDPGEFDGVIGHQDRLFFWKTGDDLDFYYGEVGAITGTLTQFPLGRLGNITGRILALRSLTIDAGEGINDVLAIFTTTGQIVCYQGNDPGDAANWRQINRIKVAPPIDRDAFADVGPDVWMLTASGLVSVLKTLQQAELALVDDISRPVQDQIVNDVASGGDWSLHITADARRVIINRVLNGTASQFVYWIDTRAWVFADYPAKSWHNLGLTTYFTAVDGELGTAEAGEELITSTWISSWFRVPRASGITFIRPVIIAEGALEVKVTILSNHDDTEADIADAVQTVTIEPDDPPDPNGKVSLDEVIAVDATGHVFQIRMEVTAKCAEMVNVTAGLN